LTKTDTPPISAPKIDIKLGWLLFITALGFGAVSTADKTGFSSPTGGWTEPRFECFGAVALCLKLGSNPQTN